MASRFSRRRFVSTTVAGAAAAATLQASSASRDTRSARAQDGTTTITMWDNNTFADLAERLDEIMLEYENVRPGVQLNLVHSQDMTSTLTALSAGTGPDVVWLWDGSEPVGTWAEHGVIAPLDEFIEAADYDLDALIPAAVDTIRYRDQVWGLPLVANAFWLWWNKEAFRDAGLDPDTPPQTIEELWQFADELTVFDGDRIERLGMLPPNWFYPYAGWAFAFGADFYDMETNQLLITEPEMVAAMNDLWTAYDTYGPDRIDRFTAGLGQAASPLDPFLTGQIAMQFDGDWIIQYVRDYKPEWTYPEDFGVAALPWAAGQERPGGASNVLRTYPLVISAGSEQQEEAWEFVRWLQSEEVTVAIADYLVNLPQTRAGLEDVQLTSVPGWGDLLEEVRTSENITSIPAMPVSAEFADEFQRQLDLAFHGRLSVEDALQTVEASIQPEIDRLVEADN